MTGVTRSLSTRLTQIHHLFAFICGKGLRSSPILFLTSTLLYFNFEHGSNQVLSSIHFSATAISPAVGLPAPATCNRWRFVKSFK